MCSSWLSNNSSLNSSITAPTAFVVRYAQTSLLGPNILFCPVGGVGGWFSLFLSLYIGELIKPISWYGSLRGDRNRKVIHWKMTRSSGASGPISIYSIQTEFYYYYFLLLSFLFICHACVTQLRIIDDVIYIFGLWRRPRETNKGMEGLAPPQSWDSIVYDSQQHQRGESFRKKNKFMRKGSMRFFFLFVIL